MHDHASPFGHHDHHACAGPALQAAEDMARARNLRLTPVRRRTLEILLETHRALGAYEVLERLGEEGFGRQPPVAYRALEFLVDLGVAHRIQSLNAFAACMSPEHAHEPAFLICRACRLIAEAPAETLRPTLAATAASLGFTLEHLALEVTGLCPACKEAA